MALFAEVPKSQVENIEKWKSYFSFYLLAVVAFGLKTRMPK
jgi:hypothetical protein